MAKHCSSEVPMSLIYKLLGPHRCVQIPKRAKWKIVLLLHLMFCKMTTIS